MAKNTQNRWRWVLGPILISFLLVAYAASRAATGASETEPFHLTILHTNDIHSHDEPYLDRGRSIGGLTRVGHMIRYFKKKDPSAVVCDAGDIFQGTPLYTKYKGEVEVHLLNMIGYDLFTIGNHEFDDGTQNLVKQLKNAKFKIINCNLDCSKAPELQELISPYVIKEIDGQKIAFIGAITPDLNTIAPNAKGVTIKATGDDWMKPIQATIDAVKAQGINKIVMIDHIGLDLDKRLGQLPDIDVIIGGHSHTRLDTPVVVQHPDGSSTTIVQTGCFTRAMGRLQVSFDDKGQVLPDKTQYHLINMTDKIFEDSDLRAYVDEKEQPLLPLRHTIAGTAEGEFDNAFRSTPWDSALGDIVCDALAESGKKYGTELTFENRGGMRARIERGPISLEEIDEVLPFDNRTTYATVGGECLLSTLEHSLSSGFGGSFLDVHGLKIAYDPKKEVGHRLVFVLVKDADGNWKPLEPTRDYKICINDYNFNGGEGYDFKSASDVLQQPFRLSQVFTQYLETHHTIKPSTPSRIVPIQNALLSVTDAGKDKVLHVNGAAPNAKVVVVAGTQRGVGAIESTDAKARAVPVPIEDPQIILHGKAGADGTCQLTISPSLVASKVRTGSRGHTSRIYIAVVAQPPGAVSPVKTMISYPVALF